MTIAAAIAAAIAEGREAISFRYIEGFAEADPGFDLIICGRTVSYGNTPKEALEGLLKRIDRAEAALEKVREAVVNSTRTLHRSQCGHPASP